MSNPYIRREDGFVQIEAKYDEAIRKALLAGPPTAALQAKMKMALAAQPKSGDRAHSIRYFGLEYGTTAKKAADLAAVLHQFLGDHFGLPGLLDWLDATGYGNHYEMIKVFKEWAELGATMPKPSPILDADGKPLVGHA